MAGDHPIEKGPRSLRKIPCNPGLRELVHGKRKYSSSLRIEHAKLGFRGWHERGYLPHRDEPGLVQFITLRLTDSFPESLRDEWEHLFEIEDDRERRTQLERYLDKGRGECFLRRKDVAKVVEDAFRYLDGRRYHLRAWVIMPNHVHLLIHITNTPLSWILENRKGFTARQVNKLLGRKGRFWQEDYWDTFMRDEEHEGKTRRYIENNPVKAGLVALKREYQWSSARYRDQFEKLQDMSAGSGRGSPDPQQRPSAPRFD